MNFFARRRDLTLVARVPWAIDEEFQCLTLSDEEEAKEDMFQVSGQNETNEGNWMKQDHLEHLPMVEPIVSKKSVKQPTSKRTLVQQYFDGFYTVK